LILTGLASCQQPKQTKKAVPIKVTTKVIKHPTQQQYETGYSGFITAGKTVNLSFQVGGRLKNITVDLGGYVKKGQLIAQIDETSYLKQYEVQKAQVELAKENYQRIKEVYESQLFNKLILQLKPHMKTLNGQKYMRLLAVMLAKKCLKLVIWLVREYQ
jgi:multidrug efflux pump subunit AcrA (membrane-fusion protein)